MKRICILFLSFFLIQSIYAQEYKLREGIHNLTLQWISWDQPGKVTITKAGDGFNIKGEQRDAKTGDFVTISGTLHVVSARELTFEGIIETRYSNVNDGKVCKKDGKYRFYAKDKRKYWRLQEMDNCEGNNVVDYVDIYF
jgi:hypothetical protein